MNCTLPLAYETVFWLVRWDVRNRGEHCLPFSCRQKWSKGYSKSGYSGCFVEVLRGVVEKQKKSGKKVRGKKYTERKRRPDVIIAGFRNEANGLKKMTTSRSRFFWSWLKEWFFSNNKRQSTAMVRRLVYLGKVSIPTFWALQSLWGHLWARWKALCKALIDIKKMTSTVS